MTKFFTARNLVTIAVLSLCAFWLPTAQAQETYDDAMKAGQEKSRARKHAEARADYQKALGLATTPVQKAEASLWIGMTHFYTQEFPQARAELTKVVETQGANGKQLGDAHLFLGRSFFGEKQYPSARAEFQKVTANPEATTRRRAEAEQFTAQAFLTEGNFESARATATTALTNAKATDAHKATMQTIIGDANAEEKKWPAAREAYAATIALEGAVPSQKADALLKRGKPKASTRRRAPSMRKYSPWMLPHFPPFTAPTR